MADEVMQREFPDAAQRYAVCQQQADVRARGAITFVCEAGNVTLCAQAAEQGTDLLPRFTMLAYTGDAMIVEGWEYPVVVDLDGLSIPSQRRPVRFAHSAYSGVGHTERIAVENGRLIAEGVVSRDTPAAREIVTSSQRGFPWQVSIGASVLQSQFVPPDKTITVNGRSFNGPLYVARRAVLGEISFVDLGADDKTTAEIAASAACSEVNTMSAENHNNDESNVVAAHTDEPEVNNLRSEAAAEVKRINEIRSIFAGAHPELEERAIAEGWTPEKAALEKLRADRPKTPAVHARSDSVDGRVLEAACALAGRLANIEKHYDDRTLDVAARRFRQGIGLQELLLEAAWANGYQGRSFRDSREVLRCAFGQNLQAGFSSIDISGILSNVANKFLLDGFESVEATWRNIAAIRNVSDFKTVTSYRLIGKDKYELVAPGGELKHGTLGELAYTNKADTYGLILSIDRRDIINDDLGALTLVPRKLGRGAGLKINDVFWSTFMANTAFFTAANKNYLTGADTALSVESLSKAEVAFLNQTDPDGNPLGVMPSILLVPPDLSAPATVLYKSLEIRDTTASTKYPVANPHMGKFRVEVSRYLSNSNYTGYSTKAWYLLADPVDLAVIEVALLNGQEAPTIETAEADFNVLGIQMRGYHDFGVALQEPRGGIKVKGEA